MSAGTKPSRDFDFFELLRQLEYEGGLFGREPTPEREPARIGQHVRLGFAAADIAEFQPATADGDPARVTIANIGLLGPEGPMPLHITRWVLDRLSQRWFAGDDARQTSDTTFVDFLNLLQHRIISLFYRSWADAHPAVQVERRASGRVHAMLRAMAGTGLPGTANPAEPGIEVVKLRHAASLASQVDGPERLTQFISEAFGARAELIEFLASWMPIPKTAQSRLGGAHAALGVSATIGPRVFSRQNRVELRLGPLTLAQYESFLPSGPRIAALKRAVRDIIGEWIDVDVRLVLAKDEVPPARLGRAKLGQTSWVAPPADRGDAEDMRIRTAVGWTPGQFETAA